MSVFEHAEDELSHIEAMIGHLESHDGEVQRYKSRAQDPDYWRARVRHLIAAPVSARVNKRVRELLGRLDQVARRRVRRSHSPKHLPTE
jgi:hypothetical protein